METKLVRIAEISATTKHPIFTSVYHLINEDMLKQCHKELDGSKACLLYTSNPRFSERKNPAVCDDIDYIRDEIKKKLRKAINDEKALQHQLKQLTRKERTHRLCTRGGMLESFLQEPERLTDDDVMLLLKLIFHRQDTQELLKKLLEREKP